MDGDIILWGAVIGLLIGIIWSLRLVLKMDRKLIGLNQKIENMLTKKVKKASAPKKTIKKKK